MAEVVVVGGGIGGMAAALRLRAAGHEVVLCERRAELGGKLAQLTRDGYTFSIGPSLLTWPEVFDDLAAVAGHRLAELVDLVRVDPIMRYRYLDGSGFDACASTTRTAANIDAMAPGEGRQWLRYLDWAAGCWQASQDSFFAGPIDRIADFRRRTGRPGDVLSIDPWHTLAQRAQTAFGDPRLRMYAARYATYSGSDPFRAPAALGCTPYLEHAHGAWYIRGGLTQLRNAIARLLVDTGVQVRTNTTVQRVDVDRGRVRGVQLSTGEVVPAEVVVSNVDAHQLYDSLLPTPRMSRRIRRLGPSSSAFLVLAAVRGRTPGLAHHNLFFGQDYPQEFREIFQERIPPTEPTIYLCCSAITDPTQAPDGAENWSVLVNVPATDPATWPLSPEAYGDVVLAQLERYGLDVTGRLAFSETLTPRDIEQRYGAWHGAIYGTPHHGRAAPFRRPGNRGSVAGLYLVGGATHPGGGLPLVAKSAEIVARLVNEEHL